MKKKKLKKKWESPLSKEEIKQDKKDKKRMNKLQKNFKKRDKKMGINPNELVRCKCCLIGGINDDL